MADKKISQLTAATTPLAGTEVLPIVQGGSTVKVSAANITAGRAVSAASLSVDGAAVINESGADADFRVEGDGQTHCLFVDASTDRIGINQSAPSGKLHITGTSASYIFNNSCTEFYNNNPDQIKTYASNAAGWLTYGAGGREDDLRITTAGNIEAKIGNFSLLTAGKGIDFSANTGAAGMTSELLNWYEEGTFTPSLVGVGGTAITYTPDAGDTGRYTRIGRQVFIQCRLNGTWTGGPPSYYRITGFPFTSNASNFSSVLIFENATGGSKVGRIADSEAFVATFDTLTSGNGYWFSATYFV
jgi:hypothetical protein